MENKIFMPPPPKNFKNVPPPPPPRPQMPKLPQPKQVEVKVVENEASDGKKEAAKEVLSKKNVLPKREASPQKEVAQKIEEEQKIEVVEPNEDVEKGQTVQQTESSEKEIKAEDGSGVDNAVVVQEQAGSGKKWLYWGGFVLCLVGMIAAIYLLLTM